MVDQNFTPKKSVAFERPRASNGKKQKMLSLAVLAVVVIAVVAIVANRPSDDETQTANTDANDNSEFVYDEAQYDEGEVLGEETAQEPQPETPAENTDENGEANTEDVNNDEEAVETVPEVAKEDVPEATDRDKERVEEIESLRTALKKFNDDRKGYPESLDELVSKYMKDVPKNPTPGGQEYSYTPIGSADKQGVFGYYDLGYTLEVGVNDLSAGLHIANPDGLAFP